MAENTYIEKQTYPRTFYVITSGANETKIIDGKSGKQIGLMPPNSQGIIFALSDSIKTDYAVKINIIR